MSLGFLGFFFFFLSVCVWGSYLSWSILSAFAGGVFPASARPSPAKFLVAINKTSAATSSISFAHTPRRNNN